MEDRRHRRTCWGLLAAALVALLAGCGGMHKPAGTAGAQAPTAEAGYDSEGAPLPASAPPPAAGGGAMEKREAPGDRPGLATHWGETRTSYIKTTKFYRASFEQPSALASLWYNDAEGARAQASSEGYRALPANRHDIAQGGVTVSLRDEAGQTLPGYHAGGKTFAIGAPNQRYVIVLTNQTPARFEVVASVDGLDVIDGKPASFSKRGYLLNPHSTLEIEGFRQSEATVAAFRFGSVRGSYAERKGDDRNVGVIGIALFHEQGFPMWPWDPQEIERRRNANPFPGQYAAPPP